MGALRFGHLPMMLIPGGPMPLGPRQQGKGRGPRALCRGQGEPRGAARSRDRRLSFGKGTCTFYGTANSNQMMMEVMGLHMPGAAFVNPGTKLRQELTRAAVHRLAEIGWHGNDYRPLGHCVDEKAIVNAAVGLLATGGSTNHLIHLPAIARAAGIVIDWEDFDRLSRAVPLIARVYPNGSADVNEFEDAGGMPFVIRELLDGGLLHGDILTVARRATGRLRPQAGARRRYARLARLPARAATTRSSAPSTRPSRPTAASASSRAISAAPASRVARSSATAGRSRRPARVFADQHEVQAAFKAGELDRDVVVVVRFQGPARQRHARAAQADPAARRAPEPRLPRRAGHRRAHVGRERQGAVRDPLLARGAGRRRRSASCATAT